MNDAITNKIAIDTLKRLIADCEKETKLLPLFLTEEIDALQMQISSYRAHLQRIEKGVC